MFFGFAMFRLAVFFRLSVFDVALYYFFPELFDLFIVLRDVAAESLISFLF